ncbi:hypothetical protein Ciccas_010984, partial [Cichlidogyrus casuarinus]
HNDDSFTTFESWLANLESKNFNYKLLQLFETLVCTLLHLVKGIRTQNFDDVIEALDTDALIRIIEDEFIDIYSGVGPRKSLQDIRLSLWNEKISLCNDEDNAKTLLAKLAPTRKTLRCLVHMACFAVGQVTKQPKSPLDLNSLGSYDGATNWIWDVPDGQALTLRRQKRETWKYSREFPNAH